MLDAVSTTLPTERCPFEKIPANLCAAGILGKDGDTKVIWDKSKPDEVEAARDLFNKLRAKNYLAFKVTDDKGTQGEQVREFDPKVERMVFTPQMQAG